MNEHETDIGERRSLDGAPGGDGNDDDVVVAVTEIGLPWMVQTAEDCASAGEMMSYLVDDKLDSLGLDRDAFVDRLAGDAPEKPPSYETVIAVDTGKETVEDGSEATELGLGPNGCAA